LENNVDKGSPCFRPFRIRELLLLGSNLGRDTGYPY
jgi:hypothetical protein